MAEQNQGFRQDLNFQENVNDVQALSNLGGVGLAGDLRVIQNNLRNTSYLPFNSVKLSTDLSNPDTFDFTTDKVLDITSLETKILTADSTEVKFSTTPDYNTYAGEEIIIENVTGAGAGFNGDYFTTNVATGGTFYSYVVTGVATTITASTGELSSAKVTFKSKTNFVFTKDDVVGVSKTVSVGSTSLFPNIDYFITGSDTTSKFKLSTTNSTVGVNTISIGSTPGQFDFIRKDAVLQENLIAFKKPDIQDDEEFNSYISNGDINAALDRTQAAGESAEYTIDGKYKGTEDTTIDENVKIEGTINLFDPISYNSSSASLSNPKSPGIFIGNTRAFSSDNNPWTIDGTNLKTDSHEVSIGELLFVSDITISGVSIASSTGIGVTSFTHKIPVTVNGETYFLLMTT